MDQKYEQAFYQKISLANKYIKRCSTSLPTRQMQIKVTMRYNHTPRKMAKILK